MAEREARFEGWGVKWRVGALIGVGVFAFIALSLAGMWLLYQHGGAPVVQVGAWQAFPSPELNGRIDRAPGWSFAPLPGRTAAPDPQVEAAMKALAAEGQAAYGAPEAGR